MEDEELRLEMQKKRTGEKLKKLRNKKGFTAAKVSKDLGVSRQSILYYESGARTPSDKMKYKISDYYNVSINDLFYKL